MNLQKHCAVALAVLSLLAAGDTNATVVTSGTGEITRADPTQTGRIFRNAVVSTWAAPKAFPGTQSGTFNYDELAVSFAPNALQPVFYEIFYTTLSISADPHLTAYLDDYIPSALATNYLGDVGSSPDIGVPASFQVIVPAGGSLALLFSENFLQAPASYSYEVRAYSDANRNENFGTVPEPTSLVLVSLALAGCAISRRKLG